MIEYHGVAYRQSGAPDAPWIASLVASAEEILKWASIPRRTERNLLGFQRAADESRITKASQFFSEPANQSPTALIVGVHPDTDGQIKFELLDEIGTSSQRRFKLSIDESRSQSDDLLIIANRLREQFATRLFETEASRLEPRDTSDELDEIEDDLDGEEDGEEDDGQDVELGDSVLSRLYELLGEHEWVSQNEEVVRDLAKPATIIDGQHRVLGAARLERGIPFTVCALLDCTWPEQVFQFTVVNYTSKPIPDQFITANAALSLTEDELQSLQGRLIQAGVKVVEYELMRVVNFDSESPFFNLVNLSEAGSNSNVIGYKTMVRVAKAWYGTKSDLIKVGLLPNLYPEISGPQAAVNREKAAKWQSDDWGRYFIAFWDVVREELGEKSSGTAGSVLWDVGQSQLMIAVVLERLQASFIDNLSRQAQSFFELTAATDEDAHEEMLANIKSYAKTFMSYFPPAFFATPWGTSSLNTGAGKKLLDTALDELVKKKGKWQWKTSSLVTGNGN